jgi:hypothetical protein
MSIANRPYVGTWALNNRGLVRHTPDALVYINGSLEVSGCKTCSGRIDLQKFITSCSVDAGVETGANTASVSMHIPRSEGHSFFRDGEFTLRPGLEINIYFRGYFPIKGLTANLTPEETGGVDVQNAVMYPYYHVFHGVVTETSYEYSGGEHMATLTCADMLHFWSYQMMSTNGSAFGARPTNSGIKFTLTGNSFNAMTPYAIMYTLYRSTMGAAGGVGFALSQQTNAAATAENGESLWSMASLYWEKRFSQNFNSLRMYGTNGTLYNAYQQAFLGRLSTSQVETLSKTFSVQPGTEHDPISELTASTARFVGFDLASTYLSAEAENDAEKGGFGINVTQIQAYVHDVSSWGEVNLFESVYETKMNVASQVVQASGFEFYQDVDGDFVFKPPFYNLDTSSNRVFVIKDIDLISITFTEAEPEVTSLMVKSGQFGNMAGLGLEGNEWGTRGEYTDFRLVAQFGFRQDSFEAAYLTNPKALFYACVSRMDLFNLDMRRAQCQIPIRAELRPGFPVYLEPFDCFYYLKSFSHTFGFGGQCTTSLTLTGRRSKFYAPGKAPEDGTKPTVEDIKLTDPWLPALPLELVGNDGIPRLQGFPNVVMALDTELVNPEYFSVGLNLSDLADDAGIKALIRKIKAQGILHIDEEKTEGKDEKEKWMVGPFLLKSGEDTSQEVATTAELLIQINSFTVAYNEQNKDDAKKTVSLQDITSNADLARAQASDVLDLLNASIGRLQTAMENGEQTSNYLDMLSNLKGGFNPGKSMPGYYRYFSSSHPTASEQGMRDILADAKTSGTTQAAGLILLETPTKIIGFKDGADGNLLEEIDVTAGIPIMRPNTGQAKARAVPTPTHQIVTLSFAQTQGTNEFSAPKVTAARGKGFPKKNVKQIAEILLQSGADKEGDDSKTVAERFQGLYDELRETTEALKDEVGYVTSNLTGLGLDPDVIAILAELAVVPPFAEAVATAIASIKPEPDSERPWKVDGEKTVGAQYNGVANGVVRIAQALANVISTRATFIFTQRFKQLQDEVGSPGKPREETEAAMVANAQAYIELDQQWALYLQGIAGDNQEAQAFGDTASGIIVGTVAYNENAQYSPVFPVSDERGYKVIGSYAYGRGLSVVKGGSFQQMSESNQFDHASVDAIDAFIETLRGQTSPSKALGVLAAQDPVAAAEIAAKGGVTITEGGEVLELTDAEQKQFDGEFSNFVSTTRESSQKVTTTNAAYGLADLGLHTTRTVCACKGAEADVLLVAYGEQNFISIDQPDEITTWLADQNLQKINPWTQAQNALRGQTLDIRSSDSAEAFGRVADRLTGQDTGPLLPGLNAATSNLEGTFGPGSDLEAAGQAIEDSVNSFPEDIENDAAAFLDFFNPKVDGE